MSFNLARGSDALRQATVPDNRSSVLYRTEIRRSLADGTNMSARKPETCVHHELGGRRAIGRHANGGVSRNPRAGLQHLEFSGRSEGIEDPLRAMQTRVAPWSCWPFLQVVLLVS